MNELATEPVNAIEQAVNLVAAQDDRLVVMAREMVVDSVEKAEAGSDLARLLGGGEKELETRRKALTSPLLAQKKQIDDLFREPIAVLKAAKSLAATKVMQWQQEQDKIRREAEEVARKAAEEALLERAVAQEAAGNTELANTVVDLAAQVDITPERSRVEGAFSSTHSRTQLDFEISNISQVPAEFLTINRTAVMTELRAGKTIPGIERIERQIAVVR